MPVRTRPGSSPMRTSETKDGLAVRVTSPSKSSRDNQLRQGSLGAVEAVKQRARRDTTTSSEGLSSENEPDRSYFKRKQVDPSKAAKLSNLLTEKYREDEEQDGGETTQAAEGSGEESDGTTLSSEFGETADSASLLDDVADPSTSSTLAELSRQSMSQTPSPKKTRTNPSMLQDLPPPRPISVIQPVSALGLAIKARRKKPANPLEAYAGLSGEGVPNPLQIKIYAPFSDSPEKPCDIPLLRTVRDDTSGGQVPVTVADAIGLSLWRYNEEGLKPPILGDKTNVNRWTMRMVEDGEVDFDFPALGRTRPIADFTSNNNRAARGRGRDKRYDEFALVEATEDQFKENERLTPKFSQLANTAEEDSSENPPAQQQQLLQQPPNKSVGPRFNPVLGQPFASALRSNSTAPADTPAIPLTHSTPRMGATKLIKIHFATPEAFAQTNTIEVTTDTYIAEVLDTVCKKWSLDKAHHVLKVTGTNTVAPLDRTVEAIGARTDLDLIRRRFGNDGPLSLTGSPGSSSPNAPLLLTAETPRKGRRPVQMLPPQKQDPLGNTVNYKKYNVVRKQPMSFSSSHQRILLMDSEYIHIMPGETGKTLFDTGAKTTTIPYSSVVGCKVSRRHPKGFRVCPFQPAQLIPAC